MSNAQSIADKLLEDDQPPIPFDPNKPFKTGKAEEEEEPSKKISSGSTTHFHKKLRDPNSPRSKWNKPESDYKVEPLLGEAVVTRMLDDQ